MATLVVPHVFTKRKPRPGWRKTAVRSPYESGVDEGPMKLATLVGVIAAAVAVALLLIASPL
jgi:hypothetical protein